MSDTNLAGDLGDYMPRGLMEWAPVIGAATASGGSVLARLFGGASWFARNSDLTGWFLSSAAGLGVGMTRSKDAGMMIFLGGTAVALPKILERVVSGQGVLGYYAAETANPLLGMVRADQINGLGYATAQQQPHAYGTVPGVAGAVAGPMQDVGGGAPVNLLGPATHHMSLAKHYGATHMGG
jgi:hypothetical protein